MAIVALVLAIASFVACPLLPAIGAVVVGRNAEKKIAASNGMLDGAGMAKAGWIIGAVNIGLVVLFGGLAIVLAIAAPESSTTY